MKVNKQSSVTINDFNCESIEEEKESAEEQEISKLKEELQQLNITNEQETEKLKSEIKLLKEENEKELKEQSTEYEELKQQNIAKEKEFNDKITTLTEETKELKKLEKEYKENIKKVESENMKKDNEEMTNEIKKLTDELNEIKTQNQEKEKQIQKLTDEFNDQTQKLKEEHAEHMQHWMEDQRAILNDTMNSQTFKFEQKIGILEKDAQERVYKLKKDFEKYKKEILQTSVQLSDTNVAGLHAQLLETKQINQSITSISGTMQKTLNRSQRIKDEIKNLILSQQVKDAIDYLDVIEGNIQSLLTKNEEITGLISGEITHFDNEKNPEEKINLTVSNIMAEGAELESSIKEGESSDKACAVNDINKMRITLKNTKPKDQSAAWFKMERWTEILGEKCPLVMGNIGLYNTMILMAKSYIDIGEECSSLDRIMRISVVLIIMIWITMIGYKQRPLKGKNDTFMKFMSGFFLNYIVLVLFIALSSLLPYSCWLSEQYLNYVIIGLIITTGVCVFIQDWLNNNINIWSNHVGIIDTENIKGIKKYPNVIQNGYINIINIKYTNNMKQIWKITDVNIKPLNIIKHIYGLNAWKYTFVSFINSFGKDIIKSAFEEFGDDLKDKIKDEINDAIDEDEDFDNIKPDCIDDELFENLIDNAIDKGFDDIEAIVTGDKSIKENFMDKLDEYGQQTLNIIKKIIAEQIYELIKNNNIADDTFDKDKIGEIIDDMSISIFKIIKAKLKKENITPILSKQALELKTKYQDDFNGIINFNAAKLINIANKATNGKFDEYIENIINIITQMIIDTIEGDKNIKDIFTQSMTDIRDVGIDLMLDKFEQIINDFDIISIEFTKQIIDSAARNILMAKLNGENVKQVLDKEMDDLIELMIKEFNDLTSEHINIYKQCLIDILNQVTANKFNEYINTLINIQINHVIISLTKDIIKCVRNILTKKLNGGGQDIKEILNIEMNILKNSMMKELKDSTDENLSICKQCLIDILNEITNNRYNDYIYKIMNDNKIEIIIKIDENIENNDDNVNDNGNVNDKLVFVNKEEKEEEKYEQVITTKKKALQQKTEQKVEIKHEIFEEEERKKDIDMDIIDSESYELICTQWNTWITEEVILWILRLNPERFKQYKKNLINKCIENETCGEDLDAMSIKDLSNLGIKKIKDRKFIHHKLQQLILNESDMVNNVQKKNNIDVNTITYDEDAFISAVAVFYICEQDSNDIQEIIGLRLFQSGSKDKRYHEIGICKKHEAGMDGDILRRVIRPPTKRHALGQIELFFEERDEIELDSSPSSISNSSSDKLIGVKCNFIGIDTRIERHFCTCCCCCEKYEIERMEEMKDKMAEIEKQILENYYEKLICKNVFLQSYKIIELYEKILHLGNNNYNDNDNDNDNDNEYKDENIKKEIVRSSINIFCKIFNNNNNEENNNNNEFNNIFDLQISNLEKTKTISISKLQAKEYLINEIFKKLICNSEFNSLLIIYSEFNIRDNIEKYMIDICEEIKCIGKKYIINNLNKQLNVNKLCKDEIKKINKQYMIFDDNLRKEFIKSIWNLLLIKMCLLKKKDENILNNIFKNETIRLKSCGLDLNNEILTFYLLKIIEKIYNNNNNNSSDMNINTFIIDIKYTIIKLIINYWQKIPISFEINLKNKNLQNKELIGFKLECIDNKNKLIKFNEKESKFNIINNNNNINMNEQFNIFENGKYLMGEFDDNKQNNKLNKFKLLNNNTKQNDEIKINIFAMFKVEQDNKMENKIQNNDPKWMPVEDKSFMHDEKQKDNLQIEMQKYTSPIDNNTKNNKKQTQKDNKKEKNKQLKLERKKTMKNLKKKTKDMQKDYKHKNKKKKKNKKQSKNTIQKEDYNIVSTKEEQTEQVHFTT